MPLQPFDAFIGGQNVRTPLFHNTEYTQNLYCETADPGAMPRASKSLLSTPGLQSRTHMVFPESGPVFALSTSAGFLKSGLGTPRTFAVVARSGAYHQLYEIKPDNTFQNFGSLPFTGLSACRIIPGINALVIISIAVISPYGAYFPYQVPAITVITPDTNLPPGFSAGTAPQPGFTNPVDGDFQDGYFIFAKAGSAQFFISDPVNGFQYDALDYAIENDVPDTILALRSVAGRVWIFGRNRMVAWINTGAAGFPFQRDNSSRIDVGAVNATSMTKLENTLFWLGRTPDGGVQAYRLNGYQPQRISTVAQEQAWQNYSTVDDAYAWSYQEEGHQFYVVNFPSAPGNGKCFVYDDKEGLWHQRSFTFSGSQTLPIPSVHTHNPLVGGHIVGDRGAGKCYVMSRSYYTDLGNSIQRKRTAPHVFGASGRNRFHRFVLDTNTAQAKLSYSNDYGATYSTPRLADLSGSDRPEWLRLGSSRSDRVFDVTVNDDTGPVVISGAYIDMAAGE